jgi:hypothetical protein
MIQLAMKQLGKFHPRTGRSHISQDSSESCKIHVVVDPIALRYFLNSRKYK